MSGAVFVYIHSCLYYTVYSFTNKVWLCIVISINNKGKETTMSQINFNKYNVTNGTVKSRVRYSTNISSRNGKKTITLYAKDYDRNLSKLFSGVRNDTDIMTDYFETDSFTVYEDESLYSELLPKLRQWGYAQ